MTQTRSQSARIACDCKSSSPPDDLFDAFDEDSLADPEEVAGVHSDLVTMPCETGSDEARDPFK